MKTPSRANMNLEEAKQEDKITKDGCDSISGLAALKAGTHFKATDVAKTVAYDESTSTSKVNSASKAIEESQKRFLVATDQLLDANKRLLDASLKTETAGKKACASVKSTVNQIKDQLVKVDSILGDNVDHKISQLNRVESAKVACGLKQENENLKNKLKRTEFNLGLVFTGLCMCAGALIITS